MINLSYAIQLEKCNPSAIFFKDKIIDRIYPETICQLVMPILNCRTEGLAFK